MVAAAFVAKPLLEKLPAPVFDLFPTPATAYTVGVDTAAGESISVVTLEESFKALAKSTCGLYGVAIRPSRLMVSRSWFEMADHSLVVEESLYEDLLRSFPSSATLEPCDTFNLSATAS